VIFLERDLYQWVVILVLRRASRRRRQCCAGCRRLAVTKNRTPWATCSAVILALSRFLSRFICSSPFSSKAAGLHPVRADLRQRPDFFSPWENTGIGCDHVHAHFHLRKLKAWRCDTTGGPPPLSRCRRRSRRRARTRSLSKQGRCLRRCSAAGRSFQPGPAAGGSLRR